MSDTVVAVRHGLTKSEVEAHAATLSRTKNVGDRMYALVHAVLGRRCIIYSGTKGSNSPTMVSNLPS